jgi:hypothetical protein
MKCNECKNTENLMEFKTYTREPNYFLCKECWNEKVYKGIKNHNSFVGRSKHFVKSIQP